MSTEATCKFKTFDCLLDLTVCREQTAERTQDGLLNGASGSTKALCRESKRGDSLDYSPLYIVPTLERVLCHSLGHGQRAAPYLLR
jgi:hypothetical protein